MDTARIKRFPQYARRSLIDPNTEKLYPDQWVKSAVRVAARVSARVKTGSQGNSFANAISAIKTEQPQSLMSRIATSKKFPIFSFSIDLTMRPVKRSLKSGGEK